MKECRVLLLILGSLVLVSAEQATSYGELAQQTMPTYWSKMQATVVTLNNASRPSGVHAVRHNISDVRNLLDMFVFAFPNGMTDMVDVSGAHGADVWRMLREDLNKGYTVIGDFQDLDHSGVNYTQKVMQDRLDICLKWKKDYMENVPRYNYDAFVRSASPSQLFDRPSSMLSKNFWEYVGKPSLSISGLANIAMLERGIVTQLVANYSRVVNLTVIWDNHGHTTYHDFRKLFRAANTVYNYFPAVFARNATCNVTRGIQDFAEAYDRFGDLNDVITAYQYDVHHHHNTSATKALATIQTTWPLLKQWMRDEAFPQLFDCLWHATLNVH